MTGTWRKTENEKGFTYYINETTNAKQWDHPKFSELKQRIDDCNYIKYSTYRLAQKFRVLQKALYMEDVSLTVIAGVFERHRLGINESSLCLESCDLEAVLYDIYFATNKQNHINTDLDFATELMLNFLYNVYDKERLGKIQVASTKVILAILSNCSLTDLYHYIFTLCADHNNCVTRLRLQAMLTKIVEVTSFMHEDVSFGRHLVNMSIENCFSNSPGLVGITESSFVLWLEKNPQLLCWIPLLHRIKISETVVHSAKCTTCKTSSFIGLRYKCLKCARYTQCQRCFFTGRTSHSHKLSHSMREFSSRYNAQKFNQAFIKKLRRLLACSSQLDESNISTLAVRPICTNKDLLIKSQSSEGLSDVEPLSSPELQLEVIIRQLELQNKDLNQILILGNHSDKEIRRYLEEHRLHVSRQISKLKILKEYFNNPAHQSPPREPLKHIVESTPMKQNYLKTPRNVAMDLFSPIGPLPESSKENLTNFAETQDTTNVPYSINDISSWIGGQPSSQNDTHHLGPLKKTNSTRKSPVRELHNDLDDALAKLQQILANNFTLDESLVNVDNSNLKHAVSEVEGMLTSFIDTVESSRASSTQLCNKFEQDTKLLTIK